MVVEIADVVLAAIAVSDGRGVAQEIAQGVGVVVQLLAVVTQEDLIPAGHRVGHELQVHRRDCVRELAAGARIPQRPGQKLHRPPSARFPLRIVLQRVVQGQQLGDDQA